MIANRVEPDSCKSRCNLDVARWLCAKQHGLDMLRKRNKFNDKPMCRIYVPPIVHGPQTYVDDRQVYRWSPDAGLGFRNGCMNSQSIGRARRHRPRPCITIAHAISSTQWYVELAWNTNYYNRTSDPMHTTCCRPNATFSVTWNANVWWKIDTCAHDAMSFIKAITVVPRTHEYLHTPTTWAHRL